MATGTNPHFEIKLKSLISNCALISLCSDFSNLCDIAITFIIKPNRLLMKNNQCEFLFSLKVLKKFVLHIQLPQVLTIQNI